MSFEITPHDVMPPKGRVNEGAESLRSTRAGTLRATPHDLERSRRVLDKPYFGPVTVRNVNPHTTDWPHRCSECGRRTHAGIDCTYQVAS